MEPASETEKVDISMLVPYVVEWIEFELKGLYLSLRSVDRDWDYTEIVNGLTARIEFTHPQGRIR